MFPSIISLKVHPILHELLGCMIVNTRAVRELLETVTNKIKGLEAGHNYTTDEMVEYISALIVGVPVDREISYFCRDIMMIRRN